MTTTPTLEMSDVSLTLGDGEETVTALDHVSLTVQPGELVAIVGPSGSGKSSLLAVAGALTTATSGTVKVAGTNLGDASARQRTRIRRDSIGFVFQSGNLIPALTAREVHERQVAAVMVTHDHEVLHHCDRVYEMIDGRLSAYNA